MPAPQPVTQKDTNMNMIKQAAVVSQSEVNTKQGLEKIALFNADGSPRTGRDEVFGAVTTGTAIGTADKTTTSAEPAAGTIVPIIFTNGNSANSPTVAFNGGTARAIKLGGTASTGAKCTIAAGGVGLFWFDGTVLHQMGAYT